MQCAICKIVSTDDMRFRSVYLESKTVDNRKPKIEYNLCIECFVKLYNKLEN